MRLGGAAPGGCTLACDFWCSTNWRIELDDLGCSTWRYDTRAPAPGENETCQFFYDAQPDTESDGGAASVSPDGADPTGG
jgi:hypothetical protein